MNELPQTNDDLLQRLTERSQDAWSDFLRIYQAALFHYCLRRGLSREDARDVCQDVLMALDKNLLKGNYDPGKGRFRNWLFRIARNLAVDKFKQRAKQVNAGGGTTMQKLIELKPDEQEVSKAIWNAYRRKLVEWAAEKVRPSVEPKSWTVFWETAIRQRSATEVAEELGMSLGSVYTAKCRMIARVRELVETLDDWDEIPLDQ